MDLGQSFSDLNLYIQTTRESGENLGIDSHDLGCSLRLCISNKLPGGATDVGTTLGVGRDESRHAGGLPQLISSLA